MKHTNTACGKRQSWFVCKRNSTYICNCSVHRLRNITHCQEICRDHCLVRYEAKKCREIDFVCSLRSTEVMLAQ